jgi:hypothetical protein
MADSPLRFPDFVKQRGFCLSLDLLIPPLKFNTDFDWSLRKRFYGHEEDKFPKSVYVGF